MTQKIVIEDWSVFENGITINYYNGYELLEKKFSIQLLKDFAIAEDKLKWEFTEIEDGHEKVRKGRMTFEHYLTYLNRKEVEDFLNYAFLTMNKTTHSLK